MKITRLEPFVVRAPARAGEVYWGAQSWGRQNRDHPGSDGRDSDGRSLAEQSLADHRLAEHPPRARRHVIYAETVQAVLVRVETADGVVGWGEAKAPVGPAATAAMIDELLAPLVVGRRVGDIGPTWDRMYTGMRVRGHDAGFWLEALSGVDIALWDAWARALGQPLHALLGGRYRDRVPVYASGIPAATGHSDLARVRAAAESYLARGFRAAKVAIGSDPALDVASIEVAGEVFGPANVYADAAGMYDLSRALAVGRQLDDLGTGFFEMPIAPEHVDGYAILAGKLDIPLALDSLPNRYRALEYLKRGALQILQPDVCRAGGITETMRIAALADSFGALATPHVSIGSAAHFAASLQCAAAIPNLPFLEHWAADNPLGAPIAPDLASPEHGYRAVPTGPGLGITIDEAAVRRLR
jgi:L-alanine-DL-glutamate epimerase-like enolase superfamily enzyme